MIICTRCGHSNPDDASLCGNCQAYLEWEGTRTTDAAAAGPVRPGPTRGGGPPRRGGGPEPEQRGVHASLADEPITVAPGAEGAIEMHVRNTGGIVEELLIQVGGAPAAFAAAEPAALSLFPGAEGSTRIVFRPPHHPSTPSGPLPFTVTVTSKVSHVRSFLTGVVTVGGFSELTVGLVPRTAASRHQTEHRLTLTNAGNLPVQATLHPSDPDGGLSLNAAPPALRVPAGAQAVARVLARPRRARWLGEPLRHPFIVEARTHDQPPLRIDGVMVQTPILPKWAPRAAVIAGVAIIAAGGLFVLRAHGSDNPPAAQVASGQSTAPSTAPPPTAPATSGNGKTGTSASPPSGGSASSAANSTAAPTPIVPGVAGLDGAEALSRLQAAGFAPEQVDQISNRVAKGKAIRTDPPSGARPGKGAKVRLFVSAGPTPAFDLIAAAPSAAWSNGNGALSFNGSDGDPHGFAVWRDNFQLEDGSVPARLLETHPEWVPDGIIEGDFQLPAPLIAGDHFSSRVGFLTSQTGRIVGEVDFEVLAFGGRLGDSRRLVTKVHDSGLDGVIREIDVDLSSFAGATTIALRVEAGPTSAQDWAVWLNPKVEGRPS